MAGQVAIGIVGLVAMRLTTEVLDPAVFGQAALLLAALGLAKGILIAPVLAAQLRLHPTARFERTLSSLYRGLVSLVAGGCAIGAVVSWPALHMSIGASVPGGALAVGAVAICWLGADALVSGALNLLNAETRQWSLSLARILDSILRPGLGIIAVIVLTANALLFVAGHAVGAGLTGTVIAVLVIASGSHYVLGAPAAAVESDWVRRVIRYAIPLIPLAAVQWVIHLGDRYLLQIYHDSQQVGLYSAAYALASQPFLMLSAAGTLILRPRLFEATGYDSAAASRYRSLWLRGIVLLGGLGLMVLILGRVLVAELFVAPPYRSAVVVLLPVIGAAYLILALGQAIENWVLAEHFPKGVLMAGIASVIVTVGAALWLIPDHAALGAAWATVVGLAAYSVSLLLVWRRIRPAVQ